jgi:hypothetical protein
MIHCSLHSIAYIFPGRSQFFPALFDAVVSPDLRDTRTALSWKEGDSWAQIKVGPAATEAACLMMLPVLANIACRSNATARCPLF